MSINVETVADAIKSRTVSKDLIVEANAPTDGGLASILRPSTRSINTEESWMSMRDEARSTKCPRIKRNNISSPNNDTTLMASTHNVSTAKLGTTRSYTFMEK